MQDKSTPNLHKSQVPTFEEEIIKLKNDRIEILESRIEVLKEIQTSFLDILKDQKEEIAYWKQIALLAFHAKESDVI